MIDGDDTVYPTYLKRINNIIKKDTECICLLGKNPSINIINIKKNINNNIKYLQEIKINKLYELNNISQDFNNVLATPFRLLVISNKIAKKTNKLYDENMYMYDDYKVFLYIHNNYNKNHIILNDNNLYIYNDMNTLSVSKENNKSKLKYKMDHDMKIWKSYNITNLNVNKFKIINNSTITKNENIMNTIYINNILDRLTIITLYNNNLRYIYKFNKKIAFLDNGTSWNYKTINERSLRGTENAIYRLANELANYNTVSLYTKDGIKHNSNINYNNFNNLNIMNDNILICQGYYYIDISKLKNKKIYIWIHHDITIDFIKNTYSKNTFDKYITGYIFVSNWQKNRYIQYYNLNPNKCHVIQNGISPILEYKKFNKSLSMIYISSPYRGMVNLLPFMNILVKHFPNLKLKIFSSFNIENNKDEPLIKAEYNNMDEIYSNYYKAFINHPNIDFYGSVPQHILFKHMKESMILFYPNTFPETCCTTILEAMACRCNVISSDIGALRETSNNMAFLYDPCIDVNSIHNTITDYLYKPYTFDKLAHNYKQEFLNKTTDILRNYNSITNQQHLDKQQKYVFENCTWKNRMNEFYNIL